MMNLDDFFTSTEMNNGLVAPYRVREFMAVMQKERDCVAKNTADSIRQWSVVASAIAATDNKDCLDLFIELDGLRFISNWLKDAHKFNDDTIDTSVEESITHLLCALGKMHLDYEKLVASEILATVQDFLVHKSSKIQDNARVLFESWEKKRDSDASISDVDKTKALVDDKAGESAGIEGGAGISESSPADSSVSRVTSVKEKGDELTGSCAVLSTSSDAVHADQVECARNSDNSLDHVTSPSSPKPVMEPPVCDSIDTTFQPFIPAVSGQDTLETRTEFNDLESPNHIKQSLKIEGSPEKLGSLEESKMPEGKQVTSTSDAVDEVKTVKELNLRENSVIGDKNSPDEGLSLVDSDGKDAAMDASSDANQCKSSSASYIAKEGGDFSNCAMPKASGNEKRWGDSKGLGTFFDGKVNTFGLLNNNSSENYRFGKKQIDGGIVDPLEVARQVAMEVEREVVDYGEQSCSSSEKLSKGNTSANEGSPKEVTANDQNLSDKSSNESSAMHEESATSSENLETEQKNGTQDIATSQATEAAQEKEEANTERGICSFDLNEEVHMEDSGNQFPAPVSTVSASRAAAAAPGQPPGGPLQFEGNLGWRGSATTSAFRPAPPRPLPESDKSRRSDNLDFDLNVVGESSSVEMNSRRSENLELDLNHTSEDGGGTLSDWQIANFFPQANSYNIQSYSSSSSKQPISNIDLNDQPSFLTDSSDNTHMSKVSQSLDFFGGIKPDDSAISIMGTRVELSRKDSNGKTPELASSFLGMGPALQYAHSSVYGYNNSMAMPFPSTVYGSGPQIPYMVDYSRGAPVMPQIVGSASANVPTAFSQPLPFLTNMNASVPPNGAGPSRSSFDLNSGMLTESGSREEPLGLGLFLNSAVGGKRKEPENGWESYPFRHYTPPWKHN
ncbi:hypothetical protein ABFS83_03G078300 [Erythranthe nasuta]